MVLKVSVKDGKESKECQKILAIEVEAVRIREEYEHFYKEVAPKAKIPGFRPGKAPQDVVRMYFQSEAKQEVLKHLISESYEQAIQEKSLEPLGYPEITDVQFDDHKLSYSAHIEMRPKVKLARTSGLHAIKKPAEVKPEEIEEALKHVRESVAKFKVVEDRPVAWDDYVIADYTCTVGGKVVENRHDDWFEIKEKEYLKGFSAQLIGARPGDEKDVRITFQEDFGRKEMAGKEAVFKVKVKEIKCKVLPEINDEMAREAGEYQSLGDLKEKIRKDLLARKEQESDAEYEKLLLEELMKHNKIELPPGLVRKRREYLLERAIHNSKSHGLPEEKTEELKKSMEGELEKEAARQVHLAFLLDEIATKENIVAGEEDIKRRYEALAKQFRQPQETIEKYYQEHEEAQRALCDQIRNDKAIEFIKKNAK